MELSEDLKVRNFVAPKAGFHPLKADEAELHRHGISPRLVENPELRVFWDRVFDRRLHFASPGMRLELKHNRGGTVLAPPPGLPGNLDPPGTNEGWQSGAAVGADPAELINLVVGEWTIPSQISSPGGSLNGLQPTFAAWIGIDGYSRSSQGLLLQLGVAYDNAQTGGQGAPSLYCWWLWYPHNQVIIDLPVALGDRFTCMIWASSSTSATLWFTNLTKNVAVNFDVDASGVPPLVGGSAEWIVEPTFYNGQQQVIADYGSVVFSQAFAMGHGKVYNAGDGTEVWFKDPTTGIFSAGTTVPGSRTVTCKYG